MKNSEVQHRTLQNYVEYGSIVPTPTPWKKFQFLFIALL